MARRGQQHRLGDDHFGDIAQAHHLARGQANGLQPGEKIRIVVEFLRRLIAGLAHVLGAHHHHRHGGVGQGDGDAVDAVGHVAGGEQRPGLGAQAIDEIEDHRRGAARHAVDGGRPRVLHRAARGLEDRLHQVAGIDQADTHPGLAVGRGHQPPLDGERADAGQDISAGRAGIDHVLLHQDLGEEVIDIDSGLIGRADDGDLGGQRRRPAHAVDLARIGRTHGGQQKPVAGGSVGGQVASLEIKPARGSAAHEKRGNGCLHGWCAPCLVAVGVPHT